MSKHFKIKCSSFLEERHCFQVEIRPHEWKLVLLKVINLLEPILKVNSRRATVACMQKVLRSVKAAVWSSSLQKTLTLEWHKRIFLHHSLLHLLIDSLVARSIFTLRRSVETRKQSFHVIGWEVKVLIHLNLILARAPVDVWQNRLNYTCKLLSARLSALRI